MRVASRVWKAFDGGGRRGLKLTLLALADYADDRGENIRPSIATLAAKVGCSAVQARREVHELLRIGVLSIVANEHGGPPGSTRHYRINLDALTANTGESRTPLADDSRTPLTNERGETTGTALTHERDGSHTGAETALTHESQSVIEPSGTVSDASHRAPVDACAIVFKQGLELLTSARMKEPAARSFLGKLLRDHGDERVAAAIQEALARSIVDPRAWLPARLGAKKSSPLTFDGEAYESLERHG